MARIWREAGATRRVAIITFLILAVAMIGGTAYFAARPNYVVLYSNLQEDDAGNIVAKLKDQKIAYRFAANGTAIEVPEDQVHELRLSLASQGLPQGGNVGFEIFDRSQLGLSEFGEKLNYQRALQGELARTICQLQPVQYARVHIVMPRDRLYAQSQESASASVVLRLRPGAELKSDHVRSIVNLVSGAVEGLQPQAVTVVDTTGDLLSAEAEPGSDAANNNNTVTSARLRLRRDYEREVERNVQTMLDRVLGPDKAVVRASATLNFDQREIEQENFAPVGQGTGVLESQQQKSEVYRGNGVPVTAGIPGTASNVSMTPPISPSNSDNYQRNESVSQYRVSRKIERTVAEPGQVQRLSVAVFVDGDLQPPQKDSLRNAVISAAGIDLRRGDEVVVEAQPFDTAVATKEEQRGAAEQRHQLIVSVSKNAAAILLLIVFLIATRSFFRVKPAGDEEPVIAAEMPQPRPIAEYTPPSLQQVSQPALPDLSSADPAGLAKVVRGLIREEHA